MLALLNELRQISGRRLFFAFFTITAVGLLAFEVITNGRAYFEMYITAQNAQWAAMKAQADAEKTKAEADATKAVAENATKQKQAEADKAAAEARTAELVAKNAEQKQKGDANKSEGEGKNAQAIGRYAELRAAAEAREKIAAADKTAAEARRAVFDAQKAASDSAINNAIARSMGLYVPNVPASPAIDVGTAIADAKHKLAQRALNPQAMPEDLATRMTNCTIPDAMRGRRPRPAYCNDLDKMNIAPADASPRSERQQPTPNYTALADCASSMPGKVLNTGDARGNARDCGQLGQAQLGDGKIFDEQLADTLARTPGFAGQTNRPARVIPRWKEDGGGSSLMNRMADAIEKEGFPQLDTGAPANETIGAGAGAILGRAGLTGKVAPGETVRNLEAVLPSPFASSRKPNFSNTDAVAGFTQRDFNNTMCGVTGHCPPDEPVPASDVGGDYYRAQLQLVDKMTGGTGVGAGLGYKAQDERRPRRSSRYIYPQ